MNQTEAICYDYYGAFCRLESDDDTSHIELEPNAIMLGTAFELTQETHVSSRGKEYERVIVHDSRMRAVGFLPKDMAKRIISMFDKGWLCHVAPTFVAYDRETRSYWVEVILVCYPPVHADAFDRYFLALCKRIAAGDHPGPKLSDKQLERVVKSGGEWAEVELAPLPHLGKNGAIYKSGQTNTEKLMMAAVEHTKGCYIALAVTTVVALAIIAVIVFVILR